MDSAVQDPYLPPCIPDPPPSFIPESEFPDGTVVSGHYGNNMQSQFAKKDRTWHDLMNANSISDHLDFLNTGATAMFINFHARLVNEYEKGDDDLWRLTLVTANVGAGPRVKILPQEPYQAQSRPDVPEVRYPCILLSKILQDLGASINDAEEPAYEGKKISGPRLALRLRYVGFPHSDGQFNVRFGQKQDVITRKKLAVHIAARMRKLTKTARVEGASSGVQFERLVLLGVTFPSRGSCQATIGIIY